MYSQASINKILSPLAAPLKAKDFLCLNEEPSMLCTFITADTAETSKSYNDATVFSFWGLYKIVEFGQETGQLGLHWLDCEEMRIEPKDLRDAFLSFYGNCMLHKRKPLVVQLRRKALESRFVVHLVICEACQLEMLNKQGPQEVKPNDFSKFGPSSLLN